MDQTLQALTKPIKLYSRREIMKNRKIIEKKPGIYAWYFKAVPKNVPTTNCIKHDIYTMLYVGISPKKPSKTGKRNLQARIKEHYNGNAYGSTLRKTLGCLLEEKLNIEFITTGKNPEQV